MRQSYAYNPVTNSCGFAKCISFLEFTHLMWLCLSLGVAAVGGLIMPFASRINATGLWAGKALASPASASMMPRGFQDALTHGWPSTISLARVLIPGAAAILGFFHSWWLPFASCVLAVVIAKVTQRLPFFPNKVERYLLILLAHLGRREASFIRDGDTARAQAASELRRDLEELVSVYSGTWVPVPSWRVATEAPFGDRRYLLKLMAEKPVGAHPP
jgi:hypothetical protein